MSKIFLDLRLIFWLTLSTVLSLVVFTSNFFNSPKVIDENKNNVTAQTIITKISQIHSVSYYENVKKGDWVDETIYLLDVFSKNDKSGKSKIYVDNIKETMIEFKDANNNDRELILPLIVDIGSNLNILMTSKVGV
jgi:hypothetical protein